jgi:hypothetical protein
MSLAPLALQRAPRVSVPRRSACARLGLCLLGLCLLGAASKPSAGGYVERAGLLIGEASRANDFLGKRLDDRELARIVARAAEGRLQAAKETIVPEEVALAHPHLLLMLEHCERAASAAALGETGRYAKHASASRDEEELFRSVLRQLGWSLPAKL